MSEHLPRHLLEALLADKSRAPALRTHLDDCERCSERLRKMEAARAAFAREHSATELARRVMTVTAARRSPQPRRRHVSRWSWAAALGLLATAGLLLALRTSEPAIRYRSAAVAMQTYVRSGSESRALREGEVLSGGEQLAFTYTLSKPHHLLLFGIDDAGAITRYFPDGDIVQSSALSAGAKRQLPVGIELDARPGRERLIALFSTEPLDEAAARDSLQLAFQRQRAQGKGLGEPFELPLPAQQISVWFDKR